MCACPLPHCSLLHLGTQEQVSEEKNMAEFTGAFRHLHQEAVLHQLTSLPHIHVLYEHTHTRYVSKSCHAHSPKLKEEQMKLWG